MARASVPPISAKELSPLAKPGAIIGDKFQLVEIIGLGGMGSVWAAQHLGLQQRVAIKLVARSLIDSEEARQRFAIEAKSAAKLKSRHVVQVYDNGELEDGTPYIAMEFLEGEPLSQRLRRQGPLPLVDCCRVVVQVGKALSRAHEMGIVHRDVKPDNVFLTKSHDDDGPIAKVLDFGIAKVATSGSQSTTQTGVVIGTPMYMSPEQARALRSVDHRSDVYSLGLVAFTMLTGNPPFSGESYADLLVQICAHPLPGICESAPFVPAAVDAWFRRACAREPDDRYQTIPSLVDAFCVACGFSGGAASVSGAIGEPAPTTPTGSFVLPSATGPSGDPLRATDPEAARPTAPKPRRTAIAVVAAAAAGLVVASGGVAWFVWGGTGDGTTSDPRRRPAQTQASSASEPAGEGTEPSTSVAAGGGLETTPSPPASSGPVPSISSPRPTSTKKLSPKPPPKKKNTDLGF